MAWLNPAHPKMRERFIGVVVETLKRCSMHGLQLDDHSAWPMEFGYEDFTPFFLPPPNRPDGPCRPHQSELDELAPWTSHQFTARTQNKAQIRGPSHQNQPIDRAVPTGLQPLAPRLGALGNGEIDWRTCCSNNAYSVTGFARDLSQPALRKAREWGVQTQIGILAGFSRRTTTTSVNDLKSKIQLAGSRGHGVIFFYWEGLCGKHRETPNNNQCWADWASLTSH